MKLFTGWIVAAGLVLAAAGANAQVLAPYAAVSDFEGPYAAMPVPREIPVPGYGPMLLPPHEVYAIVRENGFSPLGIPRQRGLVYTISVIDRGGDDGRLVIDARTGRIIRFMPAYRMRDRFNEDLNYGPVGPPPVGDVRGALRPPASVPRVASRNVPLPKAAPPRGGEARPLAAAAVPAPAPTQQSAAMQAKPADATAQTAAPAAPAVVEAKPAAPQIQPTQEMPKVQGLD
jgi:hypothetical protein